MPDVFVPADTLRASDYYIALRSKNLLNRFVLHVLDGSREEYKRKYPDFKTFCEHFEPDSAFMQSFYDYAEEKGVPHTNFKEAQAGRFLQDLLKEMQADTNLGKARTYTEYMRNVFWDEARINDYLLQKAQKEDENQRIYDETSDKFLRVQLKALFASNLFGTGYFYQVSKEIDEAFQKAVQVLNDKALFERTGIHD